MHAIQDPLFVIANLYQNFKNLWIFMTKKTLLAHMVFKRFIMAKLLGPYDNIVKVTLICKIILTLMEAVFLLKRKS
jgi:hypothetical protein